MLAVGNRKVWQTPDLTVFDGWMTTAKTKETAMRWIMVCGIVLVLTSCGVPLVPLI
jgi:hypothetical protein